MSRSSRSERAPSPGIVHRLARHERLFWVAAIIWYGIGDTITTMGGLWYTEAAEIGPVAGPAIGAFGAVGLIAIKVALFSIGGLIAAQLSRPTRVAIPVALMLVGAVVTTWNAVIIVTAHA